MGLFYKVHQKHAVPRPHRTLRSTRPRLRICRIEQMESRQLLSVTIPKIAVGATYFEDSNDFDQSSVLKRTDTQVADIFQVGFAGGAAGTNLTKLTIDLNNTFFNTASGAGGVYGNFPLKIVNHDGFEIASQSVTNGGTKLELTFSGFDAGEKLVFSVDVDEHGNLQANAVAEGAELEGATLTSSFTAPHMANITSSPIIFYDKFDWTGTGLETLLPNDDYSNSAAQAYLPTNSSPGPVYSAGAKDVLQQAPLPITLSGTVFEDFSTDNQQQSDEPGIAGVSLALEELVDGAYVATGKTTTTDSSGNYNFEGILPGTYRVVETQPDGYLSVGDTPGKVGSETRGVVVTVDILGAINLEGGDNSLHNDFAEVRPAELSGYVYHDRNNNGIMELGEEGIADVHLVVEGLADHQTYDAYTLDDGSWYVGNLVPNQDYKVTEVQPSDWIDGLDAEGTAGGSAHNPGDLIDGVYLIHDQSGQDYDFGELKAVCVSGYVYVDSNNNGKFDEGEKPIPGAVLTLLDAQGNPTGQTRTTDANGYYRFCGLTPGTYAVSETQPTGYYDGLDAAGTAGGSAQNPGDLIDVIPLASGTKGEHYDFGELAPASISGKVFADMNLDSTFNTGEPLLGGVTIYLLNASNSRTASTTTAADGTYSFTNLKPDTYGVEEIQPADYLEGWNKVGSAGGTQEAPNRVLKTTLGSGVNGVTYDFWEVKPSKISGYVFQDGPVIILKEGDPMPYVPSLRDGQLTPDDTRLAGVTLQLCDGSGAPLQDAQGNPITTVTDSNGYYEFNSLYSGVYSIVEIQPDQYLPGIDTVGTTGGMVVNQFVEVDPTVLGTLLVDPSGSAIVRITVDPGDVSMENNFSEVLVQYTPPDAPKPPDKYPVPPSIPPTMSIPGGGPAALPSGEYRGVGMPYILTMVTDRPMAGGSGGPGGYSWHLSIIDAGQPRRDGSGDSFTQYPQNTIFDPVSWTGADLGQSQFVLADENGSTIKTIRFGIRDAIPVSGDWDGSGTTKVGVFTDGLWFLDLNGDGRWDEGDLWSKLGKKGDQPVSGDWNGDGKTDIGIYGQAWIGDLKAISVEPGLPDAQNPPGKSRPKNVPPDSADAAVGWRTMKKGQGGKMRSDLIDHVFQYGTKGDRAVTGDWNGDGIRNIGIFRNGVWFLDVDGDGRWSDGDLVVEYGQEGDLPVVGDWTGDGISKLGVYRNGTFYLDTNNNRQIDATDKAFQLRTPDGKAMVDGKPVSGDWTGDGVDEVGVYRDVVPADSQTASADNGAAAVVK